MSYDDILGPYEEKTSEQKRAEKTQRRINLIKHEVCYHCGEVKDLCDCPDDVCDDCDTSESSASYSDNSTSKSPCSDECDCKNDCDGHDDDGDGCMGVGVLKDCDKDDPWDAKDFKNDIEPTQDINTLKIMKRPSYHYGLTKGYDFDDRLH